MFTSVRESTVDSLGCLNQTAGRPIASGRRQNGTALLRAALRVDDLLSVLRRKGLVRVDCLIPAAPNQRVRPHAIALRSFRFFVLFRAVQGVGWARQRPCEDSGFR